MPKAARAKMKRRMDLLDQALDALEGASCQFQFCPGPEAPIRDYYTCNVCRPLHRARQMGLRPWAKDEGRIR